jgi:hypothetical protein
LPGDVKLYLAQCDTCQRRRLFLPAPFPMQEPVIRGPFEHAHIDLWPLVTPYADLHGRLHLPQPPQKPIKVWVVVMIDCFTISCVSSTGLVCIKPWACRRRRWCLVGSLCLCSLWRVTCWQWQQRPVCGFGQMILSARHPPMHVECMHE